MDNTLLIPTLLALNLSLIQGGMTEDERNQKLKNFFYPSIGSEAPIDLVSINKYWTKFSESKAKGFISVKPPPGACFTITQNIDKPDQKICSDKPRDLSYEIRELNERGEVSWIIKTGPKDQGFKYFWPTANRVAQVIESEPTKIDPSKMDYLSRKIDLVSCEYNEQERWIQLQPLSGVKWRFVLAPVDQKPTPRSVPPNLYMKKEKGVGGLNKESKVEKEVPDKLLPETKPGDPVTKHWAIPDHGSYLVGSDHFSTSDQTAGIKGECRYRLPRLLMNGKRGDGEVECHNTLDYEVIYFRLACGPLEKNLD